MKKHADNGEKRRAFESKLFKCTPFFLGVFFFALHMFTFWTRYTAIKQIKGCKFAV